MSVPRYLYDSRTPNKYSLFSGLDAIEARGASRNGFANVCFWHLADNQVAPAFARFWTKADKGGFWPEMVCPLMTQSRHWLCAAAMVLMPVSAPIEVLV
jgi:hypothetical protein